MTRGAKIRDYTLVEELGRGLSASTWRASMPVDSDAVATADAVLKILDFTSTTSWNTVDVFRREAEALRHLSHPAIPRYIESFEDEGEGRLRFVIAMEHIQGKNLASLVGSGKKLTEKEIEGIFAQLCDILAYLGSLRPPIVHRDINPRNIILRDDGSIVLVDFSGVQDAIRSALFPGATLVGTAGYIPLEQVGGKASHRSDLYGAAATIVFLLTGRNPAELPTRNLKLDLGNLMDISPRIEPILASWLEPDVSMRTLTAEMASKILRGQLKTAPNIEIEEVFKKPLVAREDQSLDRASTKAGARYPETLPSDSKVLIEKSLDGTKILLPRIAFRTSTIPGATFSVFWIGFVAFWTYMTLRMRAPLFFPFFSIPFWVIGAVMFKSTVSPLVSTKQILISRHGISIATKGLGAEKVDSWPLSDLGDIKVIPSRTQIQGYASKELDIAAGTGHHRLGLGLSERELLYLEKFINQEVDRLNSGPDSSAHEGD
ncbi:MAG: protein kinase family protein [Spirochaetes bacterium]|nr:MAG: protein kinase family protein [Spirochaetota bacterium]